MACALFFSLASSPRISAIMTPTLLQLPVKRTFLGLGRRARHAAIEHTRRIDT